MPSGRTHETINLSTLGVLAGGYAWARAGGMPLPEGSLFAPTTLTLFTVSYLIGTFLVTPDLDLAKNSVKAKSNWGVFGLLWVPYGALFRHRGLSHTWLAGPLTRLLYMMIVVLALCGLLSALAPHFGYAFSIRAQLGDKGLQLVLGALAGYYLSQWLHLLADGVLPDGLRQGGKKRR
ncbi:MAG TPA: metal-binding protein [Trueperaceae bacterium]